MSLRLSFSTVYTAKSFFVRRTAAISVRRITTPSSRAETWVPGSSTGSRESHLRQLACASPEDLDVILGPKVIRSTQIEAAVRMLADNLLVYDAIDQAFLDEQLRRDFGEGSDMRQDDQVGQSTESRSSASSIVSIDHSLLDSMNDSLLSEARTFALERYDISTARSFDDYVELSSAYNHHKTSEVRPIGLYKDLLSHLRHFKPGFLKGLSVGLVGYDGLPNLQAFHLIIRQLTECKYTKPAQAALDCLLVSSIPLTLETLALSLRLSIVESDKYGFVRSARLLPLSEDPGAESVNTVMSASKTSEWFSRSERHNGLFQRFLRDSEVVPEEYPMYSFLLTVLVEGLHRFREESKIDLVLREMKRRGISMNRRVLLLNLYASEQTSDKTRARWTVAEMKGVVEVSSSSEPPLDSELFLIAQKVALNLDDTALASEIDVFIKKKFPSASSLEPHYKLD